MSILKSEIARRLDSAVGDALKKAKEQLDLATLLRPLEESLRGEKGSWRRLSSVAGKPDRTHYVLQGTPLEEGLPSSVWAVYRVSGDWHVSPKDLVSGFELDLNTAIIWIPEPATH